MGARSSLLAGHGDDFAWSLFDAAPDAIILVADSGEIAFANEAAGQMFGCPVEDLLRLSVEDLVPAPLRQVHSVRRRDYEEHPRVRQMGSGLELSAVRPDGTEFPVEISLSPMDLSGARFTVAAVRDITERVRAEAAYMESQEALRRAEMRTAVVEDRDRIARDLHDTVIQRLFATGLSLQASARLATDPALHDRIQLAVDDLDATVREIRGVIFGLHADRRIAGSSLRRDLLRLGSELTEALGAEPRFRFHGPVDSLVTAHDEATSGDPLAAEVLVVVREALSNVARHARPGTVEIDLTVTGGWLELSVRDSGLRPPDEHETHRRNGGHGLENLARRAAARGGSSTFAPSEDGSHLTWRVPLDPPLG